MKIPRVIHIVWVGDQSKRPDNCIETWRRLNPSWRVRVWKNEELYGLGWINERHIRAMEKKEWNGVADLMRWEILLINGGFAVDADSTCVRSLNDSLFAGADGCASFENEQVMPGLIAAGYVASLPRDPIITEIVASIGRESSVTNADAWITVGPRRLTDVYQRMRSLHPQWRLWPSHYFIPEHHSGVRYKGDGPVYAEQHWGSTRKIYDHLKLMRV